MSKVNRNIDNTARRRQNEALSGVIYGKVPPQDKDAEMAVIGACLLESESFEIAMTYLPTDEAFYEPKHQLIWRSMVDLYKSGSKIDLITVTDWLRKTNELDNVGGLYGLTQLTMLVLSSAHIASHSAIVYEKYMRRELIRQSIEVTNAAYDPTVDIFELVDQSQKGINEVLDGIAVNSAKSVGELYIEMRQEQFQQQKTGVQINGTSSGYPELDKMTKGIQPGTVTMICARPSQGKTALALNIADNAVSTTVNPCGEVVVYSLETTGKKLIRRMATSRSKIKFESINSGLLTFDENTLLDRLEADFRKLPIYIDDETLSLPKIITSIRKRHKKFTKSHAGKSGKKFMVIVDYLQLVESKTKDIRERVIADISRSFKLIAKELNIEVILLVQLSREVEKRGNKKPQISDLRESGSLEQDADVIIAIWHEEKEVTMTGKNIDTWLMVLKNKDGYCGDVKMSFAGDIQRWSQFEQFEEVEPLSFNNPRTGINYYQTEKQDKITDWEDDLGF